MVGVFVWLMCFSEELPSSAIIIKNLSEGSSCKMYVHAEHVFLRCQSGVSWPSACDKRAPTWYWISRKASYAMLNCCAKNPLYKC